MCVNGLTPGEYLFSHRSIVSGSLSTNSIVMRRITSEKNIFSYFPTFNLFLDIHARNFV